MSNVLLALLALKLLAGKGSPTSSSPSGTTDVKKPSGVTYKVAKRGDQVEVGRLNVQGKVVSILIFQETGAGNFLVKRTWPEADGPFAQAMSDFGVSQVQVRQ